MSLGYFRSVFSSPGVGMGIFLKMGSLLGRELVALLGSATAKGKALGIDFAPALFPKTRSPWAPHDTKTRSPWAPHDTLLVLGQSGLRNHVFVPASSRCRTGI